MQTNLYMASIAGQFGVKWEILVAQCINFAIVASILYFFGIKPILKTLDRRKRLISEGLQYSEEMKEKLADAERRYVQRVKEGATQAQLLLNEAQDRAHKMAERSAQSANEKANQIIEKAHKTIQSERRKAMDETREALAGLVVQTSEKVLSQTLSADQKQRYNEAALSQLANNSTQSS